jgi:hypothetical protein
MDISIFETTHCIKLSVETVSSLSLSLYNLGKGGLVGGLSRM